MLPIALTSKVRMLLEVTPHDSACAAKEAFDDNQRNRLWSGVMHRDVLLGAQEDSSMEGVSICYVCMLLSSST